jgi:hypothetical protein
MHEFGIITDTAMDELHRGPLSQEEAEEWMLSLEERHRSVVRREVSPWEIVDLKDLD